MGYRSVDEDVTVPAGGVARVDLVLGRDVLGLDAIVVTGSVRRARRREVAHSVAEISPPAIVEPTTTVDQLLSARLPGVVVQRGSGLVGSGSQIRLRGNVSAALNNEPLVYVDGIRIRSRGYPKNLPKVGYTSRGANETPSPLNDLNPADIERVEVVKGPAATTLYGAEAASGVIEIFTKRGTGPVSWTASIDQGLDRAPSFGSPRDPYMGLAPWLSDGWRQRYALSVSGGGPVGYYASSSVDLVDGVLPSDRSRRVVGRLNLDARPVDDLTLRWSASHTWNALDNTAAAINAHGLVVNAMMGDQNYLGDGSESAIDQLLAYDIETDIAHSTVGLTATWTPSARFSHRMAVGYDRAAVDYRQLRPPGFVLAPGGILSEEDWVDRTLTAEYVGSVELGLSEAITSILTWGVQSVTSDVESDAGYAEGFPADATPTIEGGALSLHFHERLRVRNSGAFVQNVVGLRDRYFLTAGVRVDGSTAFGPALGLQTYPRLGASYVVSDEPFWPDSWGRVKLRASYGHAGKAPGVVDGLRTWTESDLDGELAYVPGSGGNPKLAPERTVELELGLDGSFLDDRVTTTLNYYDQRTSDALLPVNPTPSLGFLERHLENVGQIRNRGIELAVTGALVTRPALTWKAGLYLYTNRSTVTETGTADSLQIGLTGWILEGYPAPAVRGARVLNPNQVADPIVDDQHVFGPSQPTRTIGVSSTLRAFGIELHARAEYMGGHYVFDRLGNFLARRSIYPACDDAYDAIAAGNEDRLTAWQRVWCVATKVPTNAGPIYPADFLRLRELSLRVPLPIRSLAGRATIVVSAHNLWTWKNHDFLLFDPEMAGREGMEAAVREIDAHVPPLRSVVVSLRVTP
jgi:TonB-dependent SusC/RagA subfamily outer membrane receptor